MVSGVHGNRSTFPPQLGQRPPTRSSLDPYSARSGQTHSAQETGYSESGGSSGYRESSNVRLGVAGTSTRRGPSGALVASGTVHLALALRRGGIGIT
jgi:hypothetical protein